VVEHYYSYTLHVLQVHVGNLTFAIGRINYEEPAGTLPLPIIIGVSVAIGIAFIIIIVIVMAYLRKSQESDRVMKRMQTQMDVLESRVAKECKEGKYFYLVFFSLNIF
jgi:plexin A